MSQAFIGEGAGFVKRSHELKRMQGKSRLAGEQPLTPPHAVSKAQVQRPRKAASTPPEFMRLLRDVKTGLSRLGGLTKQLAAQRAAKPDYKAQRRVAARPPLPTQTTTPQQAHQDIVKIIERELRTLSAVAPPELREQLVREYQSRTAEVTRMQLPQAYATMLHAEKLVPARVALHPKQSKATAALMQAARAIRTGRLPFLPQKTRARAQQLLNQIFGEKRAAQIAKSARVPRIIEQQRLVPTSVRGVLEAEARKAQQEPSQLAQLLHKATLLPLSPPRREIEAALMSPIKGPIPIAPHDLPRLARAVPSFATQGVASGGAYIAEADEDVHVITRNDSPLATPTESTRTPATSAPAPVAASSRAPASSAGASGGATGSSRAGAAAGSGVDAARTSSSQKIEGTLKIPGLSEWIASIEGRMTDV